jgi:catechol 2,3-dioxygenase-like lactoylglutathione lyase family enzyme
VCPTRSVMSSPFTTIDHVQLAMPAGREQEARRFYGELLGMTEIPKPPARAKRGGCWFASGRVQIHLGIDPDFHAARKAHPALARDYDALLASIRAADIQVKEDDNIPGVRRCHISDPFGNRIELIGS